MDDDLPDQEQPTVPLATVGDLALAIALLARDSRNAALSQPSYLHVPPEPPLHHIARSRTPR